MSGVTETTNATIWLGGLNDPGGAEEQLTGEPIRVQIERTDTDEVAIHATMPADDNALVSLYMTRAEACLIAARILREAST